MTKHAEKVEDKVEENEVDTKPVDVSEEAQQAEAHHAHIDGLTEGRIVHFVMPNGEHRPAVIVRVWDEREPEGSVNLQIFTDGRNDAQYFNNQNQVNEVEGGTWWRTSVQYDDDTKPAGTWHWIERA